MEVVGHTRDSGDLSRDLALSEARAQRVAVELRDAGIRANRIVAWGRFSRSPAIGRRGVLKRRRSGYPCPDSSRSIHLNHEHDGETRRGVLVRERSAAL
ncbi:hypothetical protein [Sphingomonas sp. TWP1-3-1]|uniref:hypothetical protein n=1 Tax=Sphingomonas sp. TWP1-3-1 TaxID=2804612 RepID=UPI003CF9ED79